MTSFLYDRPNSSWLAGYELHMKNAQNPEQERKSLCPTYAVVGWIFESWKSASYFFSRKLQLTNFTRPLFREMVCGRKRKGEKHLSNASIYYTYIRVCQWIAVSDIWDEARKPIRQQLGEGPWIILEIILLKHRVQIGGKRYTLFVCLEENVWEIFIRDVIRVWIFYLSSDPFCSGWRSFSLVQSELSLTSWAVEIEPR